MIHPSIATRIGADLAELIEDVRVSGEHWGRCKAKMEYLDQIRKVRLAELKEANRLALEQRKEKVTESRLDDLARTEADYKKIIESRYRTAVQEASAGSQYYAKRNALDALIETMRQERAEMRLTQ